jgi:hypothetical protein
MKHFLLINRLECDVFTQRMRINPANGPIYFMEFIQKSLANIIDILKKVTREQGKF